jgi:hypothetical protein
MQILVDIDGVLKNSKDDPISTGIVMVSTLAAYHRLIFMTDMTEAEVISWLNLNKIVDHDVILDNRYRLTDENLKERQISVARSRGPVDLFITNDPRLWAYSFEHGIPSVMFGVPTYTRVEFRPDAPKKVRAWSEIEEAINKENQIRTQDARLNKTETIGFE